MHCHVSRIGLTAAAAFVLTTVMAGAQSAPQYPLDDKLASEPAPWTVPGKWGKRGNWGRWGEDDKRGMLNYITPEMVVKAASLVKRGKVYALSEELTNDVPRVITPARVGVLEILGALKVEGELPADLVLKTSVLMPLPNAPTARLYERLGATSLNVSTDLPVPVLAEIRSVTTVPIDMYIEVPDDHGGHVRFYDVPEIVRVAAPVYLKMGLRNAPNIYPVGAHLAATAEALGRERVRRAELILRLLAEQDEE